MLISDLLSVFSIIAIYWDIEVLKIAHNFQTRILGKIQLHIWNQEETVY